MEDWNYDSWETISNTGHGSNISNTDDEMQDIEDYHGDFLDSFDEEEEEEKEDVKKDNIYNSISY